MSKVFVAFFQIIRSCRFKLQKDRTDCIEKWRNYSKSNASEEEE